MNKDLTNFLEQLQKSIPNVSEEQPEPSTVWLPREIGTLKADNEIHTSNYWANKFYDWSDSLMRINVISYNKRPAIKIGDGLLIETKVVLEIDGETFEIEKHYNPGVVAEEDVKRHLCKQVSTAIADMLFHKIRE